jgi:hypothetical protein
VQPLLHSRFSPQSEEPESTTEEINDLLDPSKRNLRIKAESEKGIMVAGMSESLVHDVDDVSIHSKRNRSVLCKMYIYQHKREFCIRVSYVEAFSRAESRGENLKVRRTIQNSCLFSYILQRTYSKQ